MRDFFEILEKHNLYESSYHNKTNHEYILKGNLIEFVSPDQEAKWKGRKRTLLWLNEANEFDFMDFQQPAMRTSGEIILDYNPSDEYHWIYDKVKTREDADFEIFTIFDNPLVPEEVKKEILRLKEVDENLWKIYGLGQVGKAKDIIFTNWDIVDKFPHLCRNYRYGLDFGYNHPTALLFLGINENDVYLQEIIYQSHLTNQELIELMKENDISKKVRINADTEDPNRIMEIQMAGFNIVGVDKSEGSVKRRIDNAKRRKLHIVKGSVNLIKEIKNYRWKKDKKTDELEDKPIKYKDDAIDAMLYGIGDYVLDKRLFVDSWADPKRDLPRRALDKVH